MGESAVLVHSYSYGASITRNESHQEKTNHALSQSISFGQFVKENLEWGKWSSFSHKKYVEEAEKYSRPGSVAQKKAFFEAHYKKIAESKKVTTTEEQSTEVLIHTLETQPPPPPPPMQLQDVKEEGEERESVQISGVAVLEDDLMICDEEKEKEKKQEEEKEKTRTKNKPVFRLSLEKTIPPKPLDTPTEIALPEKRPMSQSSEKKNEAKRHKFSLFNCFMGNTKTQDKNQSRRKNKMKKQFLCLCFKSKNVRES